MRVSPYRVRTIAPFPRSLACVFIRAALAIPAAPMASFPPRRVRSLARAHSATKAYAPECLKGEAARGHFRHDSFRRADTRKSSCARCAGARFVGADISEVSPCFNPTGITCLTVANLMFEMLCVIADGIASRQGWL